MWPEFSDFAKKYPPGFLFTIISLSKADASAGIFDVVNVAASLENRSLKPVMAESAPSSSRMIFECTGAVFGIDDRPCVEFWPQLETALSAINSHSVRHNIETNTSSSHPLVVMVCGEKSAGKSTTCRAIVNSLLSLEEFKEKGVGYFECDVGQTEFTPSTIVSWSIVKKPLIEPPFMHMKAATAKSNDINFTASFYGDLSPGQSPNRYFECLKTVYSRIPVFAQNNIPLIINTMGWMKSLGLALLVDTYRLVRPDIVLHLRTAQDTSPQLSPAFFFSADGINYSGIPPSDKLPQHELFDVAVQRRPVVAKNFYSSTPPPFFLRALSTIGHLALSSEVREKSIQLLPKCDIPLNSPNGNKFIFAGICHERVPSSETSRALLGSIVALCNVDVKLPAGASAPNFLLTLPSGWIGNEWLGLGVVLAIDHTGRRITVATPLAEHPEVLGKVNCLMRGSVTITDSSMAQIVPVHLRQNSIPPGLQIQPNNGAEQDDGSFDAQRFGGRRDFMRRKRGVPAGSAPPNASTRPRTNNF
jgi:polynucleotide 5'-hydroxyl-kinase GRC3/NOL9